MLSHDQRLQYTSHDSFSDFMEALSKVVEEENLRKFRNAKYYALLFDESTDISVCQNLIVYIRAVIDGRVQTHFLTLSNLDGCTAEAIYERPTSIVENKGLDRYCLIALGTDGASTMVGKRSGVTTRFKNVNPFILSTHCASHRLALASSDAAKSLPFLVKYQEHTNAIYKYFHYSPKHQRKLEVIPKTLGESQLRYKQVFATRWLSFHDSVKAILQTYDSLISELKSDIEEDKSNGRAAGMLKSVAKFDFVAVTHFLMDVLGVLNTLCLSLQSANLTYADVLVLLGSTKQALEHLKTKPGVHLEGFLKSLAAVPEALCESGSFTYKAHTLAINKKQVCTFRDVEDKFISNLVDSISTRFSPDDPILSAFHVLSPENLPAVDSDSGLEDYGLEMIKTLADHFGSSKENDAGTLIDPVLSRDELLSEWGPFKQVMSKYRHLSHNDFWAVALQRYSGGFPNLAALGTIYLTQPPTTVDAERG